MPTAATSSDLVLAHLDSLPTLPAIAARVIELTCAADTPVDELTRVLRGDQSLTARILSAVTMASRGVRERITSLDRAIPLLGMRAVRSIVLASTLFERFGPARGDDRNEPDGFDRTEFWKHSIAVACAARRMSGAIAGARVDPEDAYLAGLLHDLGKVALDAVFPKAFARALTQAEQSRGDLADYERDVIGVDHTVAGRRLAERWRLPQALCDVIWLHHLAPDALPASVANPHLVALVQVADTAVREHGLGQSGNFAFYDHSPGLAARVGIAEPALTSAMAALAAEVAEQAEVLGLSESQGPGACVALLQRANSDLARINAELIDQNHRLALQARHHAAALRFEHELSDWTDPASIALLAVRSLRRALPAVSLAVWHRRRVGDAVDIATMSSSDEQPRAATQRAPKALVEWLQVQRPPAGNSALSPAPTFLRTMLFGHPLPDSDSELMHMRFDPMRGGDGGVLLALPAAEQQRVIDEQDALFSIVNVVAAAFARADELLAAQRLSEDLAETNRRLQQTQTELLRSRSLAMIAEMAAGAGHELNGPLAVISGRAQMLTRGCDDPETHRVLKMISDKAHECSGIVTELMNFARPQLTARERIDLRATIDDARERWINESGLPPSAVRIDTSTPSESGQTVVIGDSQQLHVVLKELLGNATDAIAADGGLITLWALARDDDTVELGVRDNGCGMPPSVLQRAFDPFFSHRSAGRRRGLGLPRAFRIVEAHGGRIWLESRAGEGTIARVRLPRA